MTINIDQRKINQAISTMLGYEINEWDRDELVEKLAHAPKPIAKEIMRSLPVIWPVSCALFLAFVDQALSAGSCLKPAQYEGWVKAILDVYEADGLRQAQLFMEGVEENYLCQIQGQGGIRLDECEAKLQLYARGVLGREVKLVPDSKVSFDTSNLMLPVEVTNYQAPELGFVWYKFTATFQLYLDILGTYRFPLEQIEEHGSVLKGINNYAQFFNSFQKPDLARDLFLLLEGARIIAALHRDYPGLIRDARALFSGMEPQPAIPVVDQNSYVEGLEERLSFFVMGGPGCCSEDSDQFFSVFGHHFQSAQSVFDTVTITKIVYDACTRLPGSYDKGIQTSFLGELKISDAQEQISQRREVLKDKFMNALGSQIHDEMSKPQQPKENPKNELTSPEEALGALLAMAADNDNMEEDQILPGQEVMRLGDMDVELSEELLALAKEVFKEFGKIPNDFLAGAVGRAGDLFDAQKDGVPKEETVEPLHGEILYDEWDYRRSGFRKNWCRIIMKDVQPARGTFVASTLQKHRGMLVNLRRQFEMMSVQEKFEKRQREGDEIDLDAVTDSLSDVRAGLPASERLFIRLQRNERQIAVLFLVDMSSSTEGWVSTAIKEALILMSESLSVLGDRFAIYGFSGMRRTRSEIFKVKDMDEDYGEGVKSKIAGISPKEYTRMAPAIRHASTILEKAEAKIRLLITLSDGKPEDYDGYSGVYAIEDTRHALIEAKSRGIHPFCITVDKEAHDYMAHMYGEVNYIFIDKVAKLPLRIPEIYRNLTT